MPSVNIVSVFASIPGCHLILLPNAPQFTIVEATDAYLAATYCKRDEIIGRGVFQALTDNPKNLQASGVKNLTASLQQVLQQKTEHCMADQRYDVYNPTKNEFEHRVWRPTNKPVIDDNGNVQYIIHSVEDITATLALQEQSQLTDKKLQESESLFRNMVEQTPVAILLSRGEDVVIESLNAPMLQYMNKTSFEEVLGKKMLEVLPELKGQQALQTVINVQRTGIPYRGDEQAVDLIVNNKLERHYFHFSYTPIMESGKIMGVLHIALDVTRQVESRKKIEEGQEQLKRFKFMADHAKDPFIPMREDGTFAYLNQRALDAWGYTEEEAQHIRVPDVDPVYQDGAFAEVFARAQKGEVLQFQTLHRRKDGFVYPVEVNMNGIRLEGKPHLFAVARDITERRQAEEELERKVKERTAELEKANQELKRSNQNLEEFAYAASHDMKEPIRKIHFFADRLRERLVHKLDEENQRYFERMEAGAKRMSTLIDDLLLYSHVNRGRSTVDTVDLNQMLSFVLDDLELHIEEKGATIDIGSLPTIQGRPRQLQQLFENLIANALKYSKVGVAPEVHVLSRLISGGEASISSPSVNTDKMYHLIEVVDNGIGFEQADAERIFNVFTRLHGNTEYRGTGVGLSIAQKIVENHGGYIRAKSKPGEGSTFSVLLPKE